jgi:ELWxxDGT repeat protein
VHGRELWQTDGTAAGTRLVQDVLAGPASSEPASFAAAGDTLFFAANDGVHGRELWRVGPPSFHFAGDANDDGVIGFEDLVVLAQNYSGTNKTFARGDFNYDTRVDFEDLVILAQRYGTTRSGATASGPTEAAERPARSEPAPAKSSPRMKRARPRGRTAW